MPFQSTLSKEKKKAFVTDTAVAVAVVVIVFFSGAQAKYSIVNHDTVRTSSPIALSSDLHSTVSKRILVGRSGLI
jgi:hypothetical protein